jgi:hypothetical protein
MRKLLRPLKLALLAVIGAVEWALDWVAAGHSDEARLGHVVGCGRHDDGRRNLCIFAVTAPACHFVAWEGQRPAVAFPVVSHDVSAA